MLRAFVSEGGGMVRVLLKGAVRGVMRGVMRGI